MGLTPELAMGAIRFSLSKYSTGEEVDHLLTKIPQIIAKLRGKPEKSPKEEPQKVGL